ncbi:hypothetical protein MW887_008568 [Aspergillus wentii]|nr:hypothetical protein MW887_008568 [Aspergillus wentii]
MMTAEIIANSPRFRRKSSTFVDAIHDLPEKAELAPAQLYSTESGRLFHSGRIVIITVGLPARGKTFLWHGISDGLVLKPGSSTWETTDVRRFLMVKIYRMITSSSMATSASSVLLRQKIVKKCREDIYNFLNHENGQIAIYDAVNPLPSGRRSLAKEFAKHDIEAGVSLDSDSYKSDASLSEQGEDYAKKMTECLLQHRESEKKAMAEQGETGYELKPLTVWTSTRRRTVETSHYLFENGYKVRQRSQMSQLNPGVCEKMSENNIRLEYPEEVAKHELDPYHHRYPRAESYHDLAVRLEPIILELEREQNDLLIIAHESVLRVLYGYLMACNAADIPFLEFPRNEIIEIIPESYQNESKRIHIPDLPEDIVPDSPEDIKIPVPPSGVMSPIQGLGSPQEGLSTPQSGLRTPREPERITQQHVEDVV